MLLYSYKLLNLNILAKLKPIKEICNKRNFKYFYTMSFFFIAFMVTDNDVQSLVLIPWKKTICGAGI